MTERDTPVQVVPTSAEVYAWHQAAFGEGVVQDYALVVVEEIAELVEVVDDYDRGYRGRSAFLAELAKEAGDVAITLLCLWAREGFEGNLHVPASEQPSSTLRRPLQDTLVLNGGKVARAVLKREQGIRMSREQWTRSLQRNVAAGMRTLAALCAHHGVTLRAAVAARWAVVSTRDQSVARPTDSVAEDAAPVADADADRCMSCDVGIPDGHTCGIDPDDAAAGWRTTPPVAPVAPFARTEPERIPGQGEPVVLRARESVRLHHRDAPVMVDVFWSGPPVVLSMGAGGEVYGRMAPPDTADAQTRAWQFEAERDAARSNLVSVAESLGMPRQPRGEARGDWAQRVDRRARLIYRQHQAQQADEARFRAELDGLAEQLTELREAVRLATGCDEGEERAALRRLDPDQPRDSELVEAVGAVVPSMWNTESSARTLLAERGFHGLVHRLDNVRIAFERRPAEPGEDTSLRQYVCDALAVDSDDHADVRGIVSRAGRKIAGLHAAVDVMRDQLCRAVDLPLISDDGPDARWTRALDRARGLARLLGRSTVPAEHVDTAGRSTPMLAVGERVSALIVDAYGGRVRWPGMVAQLGPALGVHGLPPIETGGARVVLDPARADMVNTSDLPPAVVTGHVTFGAAAVAGGQVGLPFLADDTKGVDRG